MPRNEMEKEIIEQGMNPKDFDIFIEDDRRGYTPKWSYETKEIAKKEDKPIIDDVDTVADLVATTSIDKDELAEMLVYAMQRIDELEVKLNG